MTFLPVELAVDCSTCHAGRGEFCAIRGRRDEGNVSHETRRLAYEMRQERVTSDPDSAIIANDRTQ